MSYNFNSPPPGTGGPVIRWLVGAVQFLSRRISGTSGGGGGAPSGPAGGDLQGTYPDPTIKASVALSGNPTTTTQSQGDNSTRIATTAYVDAAASNLTIGDSVTGGGALRVLYEDGSQNLAASAKFLFNPADVNILLGNSTNSNTGKIGTAAISTTREWTYPDATGNLAIDAYTNIFTALQTILLNALGATTATGLSLKNNTAAITGHGAVLQSSPALTFLGSIQNGLSAVDGFRMFYEAVGVGIFRLQATSDGSAYTTILSIQADAGGGTWAGGFTAGGTVTGSTGLTAIAGNIRADNAGRTIDIETATTASAAMGRATLDSGTKTVSTTAIATGNYIFLQLDTPNGTLGTHYSAPQASIVDGTSFVINAIDTSGAVVTTDTSTIRWWIIKHH